MNDVNLAAIHRYHDGTKHHFHKFARSLGYLDWASQPHPFRSFVGAPATALFPAPDGPPSPVGPRATYEQLFHPHAIEPAVPGAAAIGDVLRHALGLSAWKRFQQSRWSLRVNPSSGNLHPTEAYIVTGPIAGLWSAPGVWHYAAERHALERRCVFENDAWCAASAGAGDLWLAVLTSIHWRESWKYGERAFRYCQHDLGHAIAALRLAAALVGWRATLLPEWAQREIAAIAGIDRDADYVEAEREEPACILAVTAGEAPDRVRARRTDLVEAVRRGHWEGRASQLSEDHVQWTFIDEIARATEDPGRVQPAAPIVPDLPAPPAPLLLHARSAFGGIDARALMLQRRSAVAFDGRSSIDLAGFLALLSRTIPCAGAPWDALWWTPRIHLALFVHRVVGLEAGLYFMPRAEVVLDRMRSLSHSGFLWEPVADLPLFRLARVDCRELAARVSCHQTIAADGFFSVGMIADFDRSLHEYGPSFYRHLFWESGVVGQVMYLEAEAAGARATGIGCFFDDPVHSVLGFTGHTFQSLYHFTVGMPVEDGRLTTEPGYAWEKGSKARYDSTR